MCPYPHLAGVVCPSPRYPDGMTAATITKRGVNVHDSGHCTASHISSHASPAGAGHRGIHALLSGTSDAIVADVLNAPAHLYCRTAEPTRIAPSRMNTPLTSPSQIRSGTCGSVRYTQAGKAAHFEFAYNRNGIMVRGLNRNNPATHGMPARSTSPRRSTAGTASASFAAHSGRRRPVNTRHAYTSHTRPPGGSSCRGHLASPGRGGLPRGDARAPGIVSANGLGTG